MPIYECLQYFRRAAEGVRSAFWLSGFPASRLFGLPRRGVIARVARRPAVFFNDLEQVSASKIIVIFSC
jgi:hypothetical protein